MSLYSPVTSSALFRRLALLRPDLLAQVNSLKSRVDVYLRGVGATFSHFTSHAVDHSDQIVRELSNLLFTDPTDEESIVIQINGVETYLLLLSAYLHDVGMVVTDEEKLKVLSSEGWEEFAANNQQVAEDMKRIQGDLAETATSSAAEDLFVASLEQRLLLADYFRSQHADRAPSAINGALQVGHDYLADEPSAIATLSAICVGHGLNRGELASHATYPSRRDIFGEPVNVRLLTILLRLGDLLDMRFARACPLLRSNASPLPNSSKIHWSQYERITGRVTSPEKIEIRAECESADEHRLLHDWCSWLADEVADAPRLLAGSDRHATWSPPRAVVGDTIRIERARAARYRAGDWRFRLDENEILTRLIRDVHHGHGFGFLQELVQNALDTSRARAYLLSESEEEYPNKLAEDVLLQVPVKIRCYTELGRVTCIEVEDLGLGMTEDIVQNYFLQIGRSWYRSPEFTKDFRFNATSRFGIGFLSVFAVSEDVRVTTRWHEDQSSNALEITLPGARNYLLFEDASRVHPGTTVRVRLDNSLEFERIVQYLTHLCVATEMPILVESVNEAVVQDVLSLPACESLVASDVVPVSESIKLRVQEVTSSRPGVFGSIQFFTIDEKGKYEDWARHGDGLREVVLAANPLLEIPKLPRSWIAVNGLRAGVSELGAPALNRDVRVALDLRGAEAAGRAGLDRHRIDSGLLIEDDLGNSLNQHLASRPIDYEYVARLVRRFEGLAPRWAEQLSFIPTVSHGSVAWDQLSTQSEFDAVIVGTREFAGRIDKGELDESDAIAIERAGQICLSSRALRILSYERRTVLARKWAVDRVRHLTENVLLVTFRQREEMPLGHRPPEYEFADCEAGSSLIRLKLPTDARILNSTHPFIYAVMCIDEGAAALRNRLLSAIANLRSGDPTLSEIAQAVAIAVGDETLLAYADYMASRYEYRSRYGAGDALHLPVVLPT